MAVNFDYKFPNVPKNTIDGASINQGKAEITRTAPSGSQDDEDDENGTQNQAGLKAVLSNSQKLNPAIVNGYVQDSPVLVSFEEYKKYIDAVYNYITNNSNTYNEGINRAKTGNWDSLALQKMIGRTDNQIMNDMVFHIFVSYHLLNEHNLTDDKKAKSGKLIRYIDDYRKTIETDLGKSLILFNKDDTIMFFIPNSLPTTNWTAAEHKKILSAERMNKTNYNTFPWPSTLLNYLIYLFERTREIMIKRGKNNIILFKFVEFWIIKLKKLLLGSQKSKCLRLNKLLTTNETSLGYNYNVTGSNVNKIDDLKIENCDPIYPNWGPGKVRCRRLVDARNKISQNFDKNCNIRETARELGRVDVTSELNSGLSELVTNILTALSTEPKNKTGGKKNKTRRPKKQRKTRKLRNKNIGGANGDESFSLLLMLVGVILLIIGAATGNLALTSIGSILIFLGLMIACNFCIFIFIVS
uniref:Uncharacterized protein n=1 Tax=viral metagenome TaxID=1070528 RepID=A0A6C0L8F3_9ZZZZ